MPKGFKSLRGMLLLDGGKLLGSVFHRAVVLVCQHDSKGAFGLILNQPTDRKLGEVLESTVPEALEELAVFNGGPVQPAALSYLHHELDQPDGNLMDVLTLGHDLDKMLELGRTEAEAVRMKVFAGYAGWAPGQLDEEMRRESWLLHTATPDLVFRVPPTQLWRHILRAKGDWQSRLLADSPEDLSWN